MTSTLPFVTIIVPTRPETREVGILEGLRKLDYPSDRLEILHVRGRNPSRQRNAAVRSARGDIVYFLDDDSQVTPGLLQTMMPFFDSPSTWGVCGPNLAPENGENPFAQAVDLVWSSPLGVGPKRARYCSVGVTRLASDYDLIGCNLAVRRSVFLEAGGFDEKIWPEEENDLVERLQRGHLDGLWYVPQGVVHRPRPHTLREFGDKILSYGAARMMRLRYRLSYWFSLGVAPALLVAYLVFLLALGVAAGLSHGLPAADYPALLLPIQVYGVALGVHVAWHAMRRRLGLRSTLWAPVLFFGIHVLYGLGQWQGILKPYVAPGATTRIDVAPVPLEAR